MSQVNYVSEENFKEEVLLSPLPVLVDFTAVWCGPCKMIAPIVEQLHTEWAGKVKVVKCDADQNPNILTELGIMGIPTLIMFKDGKPAERVTGYQPKDRLTSRFKAYL